MSWVVSMCCIRGCVFGLFSIVCFFVFFFFFQAEDGIRDTSVTGVQTCALPISLAALFGADAGVCALGIDQRHQRQREAFGEPHQPQRLAIAFGLGHAVVEIGRASCRERV